MIIFLIAFLCICLYKVRSSHFHNDYIMIILSEVGLTNSVLFFIISLCLTLRISILADFLINKADKKILLKVKES